ncbi:MAG: L-rhamnose mutarotase [Paenibacillaceae bacterium]
MKRYAFLMKVKEGQEAEYVRRHEEVWPTVKQVCKRAGIQNYSIFMSGTQLFAFLECEDFESASRALAEDPETVKWEKYMEPIMDIVRGDQQGEGTNLLAEVFHLD